MSDSVNRPVGTVTVSVWYDGNPGWLPEVEPREALVKGEAKERFIDALARTFGAPPGTQRYSLVLRDGARTTAWLGEVTARVTLADAAQVADGETLQVDVAGRGGDAIPLMWEVVEAGLTIASLVQGTVLIDRTIRTRRVTSQRALARDWVDEGTETEPSMSLRQEVYAERTWSRADFDHVFGLDREPGSKLLRALGYRKVRIDPETWVDETSN